MIKSLLSKIPGYIKFRFKQLGGSAAYWDRRYRDGGNSGDGSYGDSAQYKAAFLNAFVREHGIQSVIEFGCGDGNQLKLAAYPKYYGVDVSQTSVEICRREFHGDASKTFAMSPGDGRQADLALSLDVLFHLIEDDVFDVYLARLFAASRRFVVIYAYDMDRPTTAAHVRYRKFTPNISARFPEWKLTRAAPGNHHALADFFVYEKC